MFLEHYQDLYLRSPNAVWVGSAVSSYFTVLVSSLHLIGRCSSRMVTPSRLAIDIILLIVGLYPIHHTLVLPQPHRQTHKKNLDLRNHHQPTFPQHSRASFQQLTIIPDLQGYERYMNNVLRVGNVAVGDRGRIAQMYQMRGIPTKRVFRNRRHPKKVANGTIPRWNSPKHSESYGRGPDISVTR
jgi:hypothetical protein